MTRAKLWSIARPMPHKGDAREDKTRRAASISEKSFFPASVFDYERILLVQSAGRENVIVAGSIEKSGWRSLFRGIVAEGRFPQEYNRRNGRLLRAQTSWRAEEPSKADARSPKKHAGRSFDVSSLASRRPPIHHSPHNLSESRENCGFSWKKTRKRSTGSDSYLSPKDTPCCGDNFPRMTFFSPVTHSPPRRYRGC